MVAADFNGDGRLDLATGNESTRDHHRLDEYDCPHARRIPLRHDDDPSRRLADRRPLAVADFNRDGQPDIVSTRSTDE